MTIFQSKAQHAFLLDHKKQIWLNLKVLWSFQIEEIPLSRVMVHYQWNNTLKLDTKRIKE